MNPIAAQLHHRILALVTGSATILLWLTVSRIRLTPVLRWRLRLAAGLATLQLGLGIATLLLAVPVTLGVLHQLGGVALLSALLAATAEGLGARPPGSDAP